MTSGAQTGTQVLLVGVPLKSLASDSAPIYGELTAQFDLLFEDDIIDDLIRQPSMKSDRIHFNGARYHKLAEAIHDALDRGGAIQ